MLFKSLTLLTLAAGAVCLDHSVLGRQCGSPQPPAAHQEASRLMAVEEAKDLKNLLFGRATAPTPAPIEVDMYFHIVYANTTRDGGYIADSDLDIEMQYINKNFKSMGFHFNLKNTTRTLNATWAAGKDDFGMKKALRVGDYKTLNVYYVPGIQDAGFSYFPGDYQPGDKGFIRDGSVLITESCFNEGRNPDDGKTATHEIGHWLGLYHTFEGGCSADNDMVDDTPATTGKDFSCSKTTDTCPDMPGLDPIYNYMAYTFCDHFEFTKGQGVRMRNQYQKYRANAK